MPARNPLPHASGIIPVQPESQILPFEAQAGVSLRMTEEGRMTAEGGMTEDTPIHMHGISPGFPLPDNKWRGQVSRK